MQYTLDRAHLTDIQGPGGESMRKRLPQTVKINDLFFKYNFKEAEQDDGF
jgi:hypothetical protein